jgi:hypothetical protein
VAKKILPIWMVFLALTAQGQKEITRQSLAWYGYSNTVQFSDKRWLTSEIHERHFIEPFAQHQFVTRTHLHFAVGNGWDFAFGMCLFLQNSNNPLEPGIAVPELRPHIEFNQKQKLEHVTFDHRYIAEARFFQRTNDDGTKLEDGFDFGNFRFRYRLQATIPLFRFDEERALKLRISDEIHVNAGSNIVLTMFDQNRIYGSINIDISTSLSAEVGYLSCFQKRPTDVQYYSRNIIRFTVFHKINLAHKTNGK